MSDKPEVLIYDKSAPFLLEIAKEHYDKDHNPIYLMRAFTWAVKYNLDIPSWVIEKLCEFFNQYLDDGYTGSLDALMGCTKGKGRGSRAKSKIEQYTRNTKLMMDMDVLIRHGVKVKDAAEISQKHNQRLGLDPPSVKTVRQMYYDEWKPRLAKITEYPPFDLPEILESAPREIIDIIKKYPHLEEKYSDLLRD